MKIRRSLARLTATAAVATMAVGTGAALAEAASTQTHTQAPAHTVIEAPDGARCWWLFVPYNDGDIYTNYLTGHRYLCNNGDWEFLS